MSIYGEINRESIDFNTFFNEINKLSTSASTRLANAIEEHTDYRMDDFDGCLHEVYPPYNGVVPITEVSRSFNLNCPYDDDILVYVYILENHIVFVSTNTNHDVAGRAVAVPTTEIYSLCVKLEQLGVNNANINDFMRELVMQSKVGVVYVRQFSQRKTKFYEEGMKGVALMTEKKVIGSKACCIGRLNQEEKIVRNDPFYDDVTRVNDLVLEYKAHKETGHPTYFRVEYVALAQSGYSTEY